MSLVDYLSYFLFAAVQGITEFLPVSSSGHLLLLGYFFGASFQSLSFDIFLHFATFIAIIVYFRKEIVSLFFERKKYILPLIIATIPAGVAGIVIKKYFSDFIEDIPFFVLGIMYLVTTVFLYKGGKKVRDKSVSLTGSITVKKSFLIGLAQALAIFPGISRSGITISTALLLGISPEEAFTFSFLMSIPVIGGAFILDVAKGAKVFSQNNPYMLVFAFVSTFVIGYASLVFLKRTLTSKVFYKFSYYTAYLSLLCFVVGVIYFFFYRII